MLKKLTNVNEDPECKKVKCDQMDMSLELYSESSNISNDNSNRLSKVKNENQKWEDCNEANISVDGKTRWQINFFQAYLEEANLLKTGDIIWLNHSE